MVLALALMLAPGWLLPNAQARITAHSEVNVESGTEGGIKENVKASTEISAGVSTDVSTKASTDVSTEVRSAAGIAAGTDGNAATATGPLAALDASKGAELARSKACLACHQEEARRVGPPYREIAARYASSQDKDGALGYLANAIRNGGRGRWGAIPMPAQPHVTPQEARILAAWILSLAPDR